MRRLVALALCAPLVGGLRPGVITRLAALDDAPPSVVLRDGHVVGDWVEVEGATQRVARFRGVPFGASTAGAGRWAPPAPPAPWGPATLEATAWGPACAQAPPSSSDPDVPTVQSEDCLNVNVFTPASALGRPPDLPPVPVLLWFHGGAFVAGSNAGPWTVYDGSRTAALGNVVVVSANYRLDAFGWLVTSAAGGAGGNFGLLDQRAAMRWVRDNVAAFGGDPARVTLWGESAGAMSGLVHMVSPPSAGLFQRVIMQSNPAGFSYTTPAYMAVYGDALASQAGCGRPPKGVSQLDCLRNVSSASIMTASAAVMSSYYDVARGSGWSILDGVLQWGPVLDPTQLPLQPMAAVAAGTLHGSVDVLVGHNTDEVATFLDASHYAASYPTLVFETVLLSVFGIRGASAVKAQYARYGFTSSLDELDRIMTDYWFKCAKEAVTAAAGAAGGRAWSYRFHHNISFGPDLWGQVGLPQCVPKVCHTAELVFVFGNSGDWAFTAEERAFSDALMTMWTNFAHTGDPTAAPERGAGAAAAARRALRKATPLPAWPAFSNDTRLSLVLSPEWGVENSTVECPFWDALGYANH